MKYIKAFFSIILSIFFTIVLTIGIFSLTINLFLSKQNMKNIVSKINVEDFVKPNISDIEKIGEKYLEIPEVKELVDKYIDFSIDYIFDNKNIPEITDEDIEKIVNSDYYKNVLGISLSDEEKTNYSNELKEVYVNANETLQTEMDNAKNELYENDILKIIFSDNFIPKIIITLIVIVILLGICRWSWYRPFSWLGVSMIIAGGINILFNKIVGSELVIESHDLITNELITKWFNGGLIGLITGFIFLVCYFIFKTIFGKTKEEKLLDEL